MIVQYYSDSLGLQRPGIVTLQQRYIHIFEAWLKLSYNEDVFLTNRARRGFTVEQLFEVFLEDEEYLTGERDILIIHEGICDCAPRPVSKRLRNVISVLPGFLKTRIISLLHNNRAAILKRGMGSYLVEKKRYEEILTKWLSNAKMNYKRIYIFNIAPTNKQIEEHSPGFSGSIDAYNKIISKVVLEQNDNRIHLIDVHSIIKKTENIDELITKDDGHHLTAEAHKLYADCLINLESTFKERC